MLLRQALRLGHIRGRRVGLVLLRAPGAKAGRPAELQVVEPLALEAPWPDAALTFAPAGHVPSPTVPGALVRSARRAVDRHGAVARGLGGALVARVSRRPALWRAARVVDVYVLGVAVRLDASVWRPQLLVACSPAFLFQLMQPMSDVPAAALWMLAVASRDRDEPRAPVVGRTRDERGDPGAAEPGADGDPDRTVHCCCVPSVRRPERIRSSRHATRRHRRLGAVAVAFIQQVFYGSPLAVGIRIAGGAVLSGPTSRRMRRRYFVVDVAGAHARMAARASGAVSAARSSDALLLSLAAVNVACYLPYAVFDDWSYLRFLLPTIAARC